MGKDVHFSPLSDSEKGKVLSLGFEELVSVQVWQKTNKEREHLKVIHFNTKENVWKLESLVTSNLDGKEVLATFEIKGTHFFSKGKIDLIEKERILSFEGPLYKCERRKNFRLKILSHRNVNVILPFQDLEEESLTEDKNEETSIFHDFLRMIDSQKSRNIVRDNMINFHVQDLSVSGLSFCIFEKEKKLFTKGDIKENFKLDFNQQSFSIPKAEVVYVAKIENPDIEEIVGEDYSHKVALKFLEVSVDLDSKIQNEIQKEMRSMNASNEFEDFLGL